MPPIASTLSLNTNFLTRKSLSDFAVTIESLLCPALLEDSSDDVVYEQPHTGKVCKCVVFAGLPYSYFITNPALPASTLCVLGWLGLSLIRCYTRLQPATLLCVILLRYKGRVSAQTGGGTVTWSPLGPARIPPDSSLNYATRYFRQIFYSSSGICWLLSSLQIKISANCWSNKMNHDICS